VQVAAVVALVLTLCDGFEGTLLVIVAMQLGGRLPRGRAFTWIAIQTLLLAIAITIHWSLRPAILLTPPYLGFQLLAYLAFEAMARESRARRELETANAELLALQTVLADSSRMAERLRMSRDLHDAIGHHLTALTLNLEAALQRSNGDLRERIATAQSLARTLLADVREIVAATQTEKGVDLAQAIAMVANVPRPRVHLEIADDVRVDNPESARTIIRCAQEIVTNAARHSGAENLWIVLDVENGAVRIRAHDDGRGTAVVRDGFGLRAMRGRVEEIGGELRIVTTPGAGFEVIAVVPT
jgi:signal transduction histidine kinase